MYLKCKILTPFFEDFSRSSSSNATSEGHQVGGSRSLSELIVRPHSHFNRKSRNRCSSLYKLTRKYAIIWLSEFWKLNVESYKYYILTRFMDSKLIGDPLANRRGKLDCITSFFSLPLLLLEAITGASLEDSGLIWVWHFCPVQLWSSCLEAKCVPSHWSEAWWIALKEVKLGIVRYSPMVTFPVASLQKSVSSLVSS